MAAAEKKISAEELFESVCSLKAAGTQMQLQDGEPGFDPEMHMIRSQIMSIMFLKKSVESVANCQSLRYFRGHGGGPVGGQDEGDRLWQRRWRKLLFLSGLCAATAAGVDILIQ